MPWVKGTPRKGHINKDGTPHAAKGSKLTRRPFNPETDVIIPGNTRTGRPQSGGITIRKVSADLIEAPSTKDPYKGVPVNTSGRPNRPITEPCRNPECGYPYADGGYCEKCGWMAAIVLLPYGTSGGQR
jgi:hypothetical protein